MKPRLRGAAAPENSLNSGAEFSVPTPKFLFPAFPGVLSEPNTKKPHKNPTPLKPPAVSAPPHSRSFPVPCFSRDEHDGGGLGDEAGATRCGHHHQLSADGGPDQLPGALTAPRTRLRTRFLPIPREPRDVWQIPLRIGAAPRGEDSTSWLEGRKK